ncbi:MAG: hypothetical protein ABL974_17905 [Prosthecobacter sp.]
MRYSSSIVVCAALLLFAAGSSASADQSETVASAERPRLALYAEDVTMDGQPRPDLARALTDSLSAGLLKRGQVRVFSLESAAGRDATGMIASPAASTAARVNRLLDDGLDYVMTFNVLGIGSECLLSVKKMRARTHEVMEAHQFTSYGHEAGLFKIIGTVLERVDPRPAGKPIFPRTQSPAALAPAPMSEFVAVPKAAAYDPWRENVPPVHDLTHVRKALVYRELGTVKYINPTWKFCVIRPAEGTQFEENDPLHILWDEGDVYAALRVCAIERGGVVADMGKTPDHHPLFQGDKVFGWAPPLR